MHQWAVDLVMNKYPDIGDHYAVVDSKTQKAINRAYLQKILQNIIFLSRHHSEVIGSHQKMAVVVVRRNPTSTN